MRPSPAHALIAQAVPSKTAQAILPVHDKTPEQSKLCSGVAEMERFELSRRF